MRRNVILILNQIVIVLSIISENFKAYTSVCWMIIESLLRNLLFDN